LLHIIIIIINSTYLSHSCLSAKLFITVKKAVHIVHLIEEYELNPAKIGGILSLLTKP